MVDQRDADRIRKGPLPQARAHYTREPIDSLCNS